MRFYKNQDFWIELMASGWTLAGIYLGSTTTAGAACYGVSLIFWYWLMWRKALWGMAPLNVATTVMVALNLLRT